MEQLVIVDEKGIVRKFSPSKQLGTGEATAVELVIVCLPHKKQIVLFNRASGASDMRDHWALVSGKVNVTDLTCAQETVLGTKLSLEAYRNAAVREFNEELAFRVSPDNLQLVDEFHMPSKQIYFTLFSLILDDSDLDKLLPNQTEVDRTKCFTLREFMDNGYLGDAIMFRKEGIIRYLQNLFRELE